MCSTAELRARPGELPNGSGCGQGRAFATRLAALKARGIDTGALPFEASLGRTTMEYYDGFTFAFVGPADLPPVASGGRYDALTAVLGQGRSIPAVGGIIRPNLVAALRGATRC